MKIDKMTKKQLIDAIEKARVSGNTQSKYVQALRCAFYNRYQECKD